MKMWFVNNIYLDKKNISSSPKNNWEKTERGWERIYSERRKLARLDINDAYRSLSIYNSNSNWIDIVEEIEVEQ